MNNDYYDLVPTVCLRENENFLQCKAKSQIINTYTSDYSCYDKKFDFPETFPKFPK